MLNVNNEAASDSHPVSPLEPLDPHRLRDMVVDKQGSGSHATSLPSNWSSPQSTQVGVAESPNQAVQGGSAAQASVCNSVQSPVANMHRQFSQAGLNSPHTTPLHNPVQSPFAPPPQYASTTNNPSPFSTASTTSQQPFVQYGAHVQIGSSPITSPGPAPSPHAYGSVLVPGMHARVLPTYPAANSMPQMIQYTIGPNGQTQWIQQQQVPVQYVQQRIVAAAPGGQYPAQQRMPAVRSPYPPGTAMPFNAQTAASSEAAQPHNSVLASSLISGGPQPQPAAGAQQYIAATVQPQPQPKLSQAQQPLEYASSSPVFMLHTPRFPAPPSHQPLMAASMNVQQHQQLQQQIYYQQFSRHQMRGAQPQPVYPIGVAQMPQLVGGASQLPTSIVQAVGMDGFIQPQMVRYALTNGDPITAHALPLAALHLQQQQQQQQQSQQSPISPVSYRQPMPGVHPSVTIAPTAIRPPSVVSPMAGGAVALNVGPLGPNNVVPIQQPPNAQHIVQHSPANGAHGPTIPANASIQHGIPFPQRVSNKFCSVEALSSLKHSPDVCLAGCVFLLMDDFVSTQVDRASLMTCIRYYGGDIDVQMARGIPDRITHVICTTVAHNDIVSSQVLNDRRKRLVTLQWLNEAIMKRRVEAPTRACHLPSCYNEHNRPAVGNVIVLAGFNGLELANVRSMLRAVGATYAEKLNSQCHILIAKSGSLAEIDMARQFSPPIAVVNYQWLIELYFGNVRALAELDNANYSALNANAHCETIGSPYVLERFSEFCQKLMFPWKLPIQLTAELLDRAYELRRTVDKDTSIFPHLQYKFHDDAPSEQQIAEALALLKAVNCKPTDVHVHFDGLSPPQMEHLSRKVRFLGAEISASVADCTHFVAPTLERTVKLVQAIACGKHIVSPEWILSSFTLLRLADPLDFFIHDSSVERKYGFNLKNTILHSRRRRIFQNVTFHLSASVEPSYEIVRHLIVSAGGKVESDRPRRRFLGQCIQNDQTYFVIVNDNDLVFYNYLIMCNFPLFTEEFVTMSILRHEIDVSTAFRLPISYNQQKMAVASADGIQMQKSQLATVARNAGSFLAATGAEASATGEKPSM